MLVWDLTRVRLPLTPNTNEARDKTSIVDTHLPAFQEKKECWGRELPKEVRLSHVCSADPNAAVPQPNRERARIWYAPRPTCGRCPSLVKHARSLRACHNARPYPWPDENVSDRVFVVNNHLHSPSGRVGPSGPERAIRIARNHVYQSQFGPTRPLTRPTSPRATP